MFIRRATKNDKKRGGIENNFDNEQRHASMFARKDSHHLEAVRSAHEGREEGQEKKKMMCFSS